MVMQDEVVKKMFCVGFVGICIIQVFLQDCCWDLLDDDCVVGCICLLEYVYSKDGGLVVLYGNFVENGCIVKIVGVDDSIFKFIGLVKVYESQDEVVEVIFGGKVVEGDVVVICYEGLKGGLGMQEMFYLISFLKLMGLGKVCVFIIDGCFFGGIFGFFIGYVLLEVVSGGIIVLIEDGDIIVIDILNCSIQLQLSEVEIVVCCEVQEVCGDKVWMLKNCQCQVLFVLCVYVSLVISVDKGVVCDKLKLGG